MKTKQKIILAIVIAILVVLCAYSLSQKFKIHKIYINPTVTSSQIITPTATSQPSQAAEILTPKEVVQKYIEADMSGVLIGEKGPDISQYYTENFAPLGGSSTMVIKKYEIIGEYQSEDKSIYYIKINYYCDKVLIDGSTGLKDEKINRTKDGDINFSEITCSNYFIDLSCSNCADDNNPTNKEISFDIKTNIETVNFELVKDGQVWKINAPQIIPHISETTLAKHVEYLDEINK